jgi:hypothetical protein
MSTLVIKKWNADACDLDSQGTRINIEGREAGLLAWLLHLVQIEPITRFRVTVERADLERTSLSGKEHIFVPLENISHCHYGYHKPWKKAIAVGFLVWWIMSFLLPLLAVAMTSDPSSIGSIGARLLTGVIALIFASAAGLVYYLLTKSFLIGLVTHSGHEYALCFKRSIIENQQIDADEAAYVTEMLDFLCNERRRSRV